MCALSVQSEFARLYSPAAAALTLTGPGGYSVDALLGLTSLWTPAVAVGALAVGIVGGIINVAMRRPAAQAVAA